MTDEETYTLHHLTGLGNPAGLGLPEHTAGSGVLRVTANSTGQRATFIVDAEYAALILEAQDIAPDAVLSATAVRWMRLGWPEEWPACPAPEAWARVYPAATGGGANV
ncbi:MULTISPECIES: hypothetical protein [Arthrobacter]|uniref:Uncharacterized protein n=1 Tax=Arthrobacter terricola TaxID=2547396 RepID=A0A4R5K7I6_9MICC|nr:MULTISPECIES: hypothetical protein [Arthrobacter]MBT8159319.1 hypothetical protein [Arthrobacter sp. GN70]TDF86875.1 hypothetical protein E1809_25480 [Arthrobacter terricola]